MGQKNRGCVLEPALLPSTVMSSTFLLMGPCRGQASLVIRPHLNPLTHMHAQVPTLALSVPSLSFLFCKVWVLSLAHPMGVR